MILFRKRVIHLAEIRFARETSEAIHEGQNLGIDVLYLLQNREPVPFARITDSYTLTIDLSPGEESLFAGFDKTTRYEIRRAEEKDGLRYRSWRSPDQAKVNEFLRFFNEFARTKGLKPPSRHALEVYSNAGVLDLSHADSGEGTSLVWHAHHVENGRARLLLSCSLKSLNEQEQRKLVGRANRALHWNDMRHFKSEGLAIYDFGGWYPGKDDSAKLGINAFKEGFGGKLEKTFNCELALTTRGKVYTLLKQARLRFQPINRD